MAGRPLLRVYLANAAGSFVHDITDYASLVDGWSVKRGRGDEDERPQPGSVSLLLKNNDGRFTLGSATYGIDADQMIRITEKVGTSPTRIRFTGYVEEWPTEWTSPLGNAAVAKVTAYDRLAQMAREDLRPMMLEQILLDDPVAYYPLGEESGAVSGGDLSGDGRASLVQFGSGTAVTFGAGSSPGPDGGTIALIAGGKFLSADLTGAGSGASLVVECWFARFGNPAASEVLARVYAPGGIGLQAELSIRASGGVGFYVPGGTPAGFDGIDVVTDGAWHHAALVKSTDNRLYCYVDGVLIADANCGWSAPYPVGSVDVGGDRTGSVATSQVSIAHVAVYNDSQAGIFAWGGQAAAHWTCGRTGFAGESSANRIRRLASYVGLAAGDLNISAGALTATAAQPTAGVSVVDAMNSVAVTEGAPVFVAGDGKVTAQARTARALASAGSPVFSFTTRDLVGFPSVAADKRYLANRVSGSRPGGASQAVEDKASLVKRRAYPQDLGSLLATSDAEVMDRLQWELSTGLLIRPRMAPLTVNLLPMSAAQQDAALLVEIGSLVRLSTLPAAQAPAGVTSVDLIVEGVTETQGRDEWSLQLTVVPAEIFRAWVLGDATYGVLGTTTRLYY